MIRKEVSSAVKTLHQRVRIIRSDVGAGAVFSLMVFFQAEITEHISFQSTFIYLGEAGAGPLSANVSALGIPPLPPFSSGQSCD